MAKIKIVIKDGQATVETIDGFAGQSCLKIQDLLSGEMSKGGAKTVKQELTVNADAHDREEAVPEHVQH